VTVTNDRAARMLSPAARSSSRQIREVLYALWPERRPYAEVKVEAATP